MVLKVRLDRSHLVEGVLYESAEVLDGFSNLGSHGAEFFPHITSQPTELGDDWRGLGLGAHLRLEVVDLFLEIAGTSAGGSCSFVQRINLSDAPPA